MILICQIRLFLIVKKKGSDTMDIEQKNITIEDLLNKFREYNNNEKEINLI